MGRKLDLSGLTDNEAQHVLQVVQRDMKLRKTEEERLSELKQELDEEGSRCLLLSRQSCFNQRCCIRCCSPFTFLLNPKRQCQDCCYNVCKACRVYNKRDKAWLCSACQKRRLLKAQSLEWFYTNVKQRFKRFGSAKVLKTLYRKHVAEHSALSELTEGSAYEESICNEGSVCESDSNFYRQSEEHSMAETLTVALRVAEEAIDEAISKAEFDVASQEQNEALYLREHRGELIEELAKTIVQKIVSRRKTLAEKDTDPHHHHQSISAQTSTTHQPGLWRSQSAFSLLNDDPPDLIEQSLQALKKEGGGGGGSSSGGGGGGGGPPMSAWKSVDRLDNSVLKSPDGNWIALQSAQLSRPGLLTRRKSLVYSALERESRVVSAYEGMGSDNESKPEPDSSWGAVLHEIHKKMMDSNLNVQDGQDRSPTPVKGRRGSRDYLFSDSESKSSKPVIALLKRKVPAEIRRPSSSRRTSIIDVNFNIGETEEEDEEKEEESSMAAELEKGKVKKTRKKRRSKKEQLPSSSVSDSNKKDKQSRSSSDAVTPDTLTSGAVTPEHLDIEREETGHEANQVEDVIMFKFKHLAGRALDSSTQEEKLDEDFIKERRRGSEDRDEGDEMSWKMEIDLDEERDFEMDEEMKSRLYKLVAQSRLTYFSSTDDELNQVGDSEGEWDEDKRWEEKTEGLTFKLCRLEKEVRATQFSSTEDELDRIGIDEKTEEEELAVKVCRLASQVNATQFSSTEDELDRAGIGEDEAIDDEETLWKLQAEKALQAAQLRDLASLVSGSQFSSTEDELDRVKENEGEREWEANEGGTENGFQMEEVWKGAVRRRRSFSDLDVKMFDMRDETQETETENILDGQIKTDDVQRSTTEAEEPEWTDSLEEGVSGEIEDEVISVEEQKCEDALEEEQEIKSLMEAEETKEVIDSKEMRVEQEYQPGANRPLNNEEDGQREEFKESKDGKGRWETTTDSEEEDTEFDRIISSMLMMTLEDMQEEMPKDPVSENVRRNTETEVCVTTGKESDAQSTTPPEEMGGAKEFESRGDNVFAARGGAGENATEETGGNVSEEKGEGEITRRNKNEQEERGMEKQDEIDALNMNEAQQTVGEEKSLEEQSGTSSPQEGLLSPEEIQQGSDKDVYKTIDLISSLLKQRYSAGSLRSITTEVLKVLNATEELLQGMEGGDGARLSSTPLPLNTDPKKLDQQFSRLEENVYVAAGSVFSLEAELSDLEECARGICSSTSDLELSFLEEQVASAAAKVQQSELQICDISARIAALKSAGLNVDPQSRLPKTRTVPVMSVTLDSSRQLRRRLPAPPAKEDKET